MADLKDIALAITIAILVIAGMVFWASACNYNDELKNALTNLSIQVHARNASPIINYVHDLVKMVLAFLAILWVFILLALYVELEVWDRS